MASLTAFTFTIWFRVTEASVHIVSLLSQTDQQPLVTLSVEHDVLYTSVAVGSRSRSRENYCIDLPDAIDAWHKITLQYTGSQLVIMVDSYRPAHYLVSRLDSVDYIQLGSKGFDLAAFHLFQGASNEGPHDNHKRACVFSFTDCVVQDGHSFINENNDLVLTSMSTTDDVSVWRQLQMRLLASWTAAQPATLLVYPKMGTASLIRQRFRSSSTPSLWCLSSQCVPSARDVTQRLRAKLCYSAHAQVQCALSTLGGVSVLLFNTARIIELNPDCTNIQCEAIDLLMMYITETPERWRKFLSQNGLCLLRVLIKSDHCILSVRLLKALLLHAVETSSTAPNTEILRQILVRPEILFNILFPLWSQWSVESREVLLERTWHLVRDKNTKSSFNLEKILAINGLEALLDTFKEVLNETTTADWSKEQVTSEVTSQLTANQSATLVNVITAILAAAQWRLHLVSAVMDFLLVTQNASQTFIAHQSRLDTPLGPCQADRLNISANGSEPVKETELAVLTAGLVKIFRDVMRLSEDSGKLAAIFKCEIFLVLARNPSSAVRREVLWFFADYLRQSSMSLTAFKRLRGFQLLANQISAFPVSEEILLAALQLFVSGTATSLDLYKSSSSLRYSDAGCLVTSLMIPASLSPTLCRDFMAAVTSVIISVPSAASYLLDEGILHAILLVVQRLSPASRAACDALIGASCALIQMLVAQSQPKKLLTEPFRFWRYLTAVTHTAHARCSPQSLCFEWLSRLQFSVVELVPRAIRVVVDEAGSNVHIDAQKVSEIRTAFSLLRDIILYSDIARITRQRCTLLDRTLQSGCHAMEHIQNAKLLQSLVQLLSELLLQMLHPSIELQTRVVAATTFENRTRDANLRRIVNYLKASRRVGLLVSLLGDLASSQRDQETPFIGAIKSLHQHNDAATLDCNEQTRQKWLSTWERDYSSFVSDTRPLYLPQPPYALVNSTAVTTPNNNNNGGSSPATSPTHGDEHAMRATRHAVELQNSLRKSYLLKLDECEANDARARDDWKELAMRLTHERAVWHSPNFVGSHWELDPTEGPLRMRIRLRRTHLKLARRFWRPRDVDGEREKADGGATCGAEASEQVMQDYTPPLGFLYQEKFSQHRPRTKERVLYVGSCVTLVSGVESRGEVLLTDSAIRFLPDPENSSTDIKHQSCFPAYTGDVWALQDIVEVLQRRHELVDDALEVFTSTGRSVLLVFPSTAERDDFSGRLVSSRSRTHSLATESLSSLTKKWQQRRLSNFAYLTHLNKLAGRSFNDLMQYPVFPFILSQYSGDVLDLNAPEAFRNLAKPVAVQHKDSEERYMENYRMTALEKSQQFAACSAPFHYGSHYSNSGTVLYFLVRLPPFTQAFLCYQDDNFDLPDRTFHSLETTWRLASLESTTDVKELVPEFFYLPEFLVNVLGFNFGVRQNHERVEDVELPSWCNGDARLFVLIHRQALESDYVTEHLNQWIDLVFGYKQQGKQAVDAINVFHPVTYGVDLLSIEDSIQVTAIRTMIRTYGQMPKQLFTSAHPMVHLSPTVASKNRLVSHSRNRAVLHTVKGLRWGGFVGSPDDVSDPALIYTKSYSFPVGALTILHTGDFAVLQRFTCLFVVYNTGAHSESGSTESDTIQSSAIVSWRHHDGIVRIKLRKDASSIPLFRPNPFYLPPPPSSSQYHSFGNGTNAVSSFSPTNTTAATSDCSPSKNKNNGNERPSSTSSTSKSSTNSSSSSLSSHGAWRSDLTSSWNEVTTCACVPGNSSLFIGQSNGAIDVLTLELVPSAVTVNCVKRRTLLAHSMPITDIAICTVFAIAVSTAKDGLCIEWDLNGLTYIRTLYTASVALRKVCISNTLGDVATIEHADDGVMSAIHVSTINGRSVGRVSVGARVASCCYSTLQEGAAVNVIVCACADGSVRFYSSWTLSPLNIVLRATGDPITCVGFSPDCHYLSCADVSGTVYLWERPQHVGKSPRFITFP